MKKIINTHNRLSFPPDAIINIEHEREGAEEEVEFQIKWRNDG